VSDIDLSDAILMEISPGRWTAFFRIEIKSNLNGWLHTVAEVVGDELGSVSADAATAELVRRGEMTGHEAMSARLRAMGGAA